MGYLHKSVRGVLTVAVGAAAISVASGGVSAGELKLAHFMPPQHVLHREVFVPLQEELEKISNGDLTIKIFPAGALGKGPEQQYKRAVEGVADIVFGIPQYTSTIFPRTLIVNLPGVSRTAEEAAVKSYAIFDKHLAVEYQDVKLLGLFANAPSEMILKNKLVRVPGDLKGLKIRVPSPELTKLIQAWNAAPVSMPISDAYNSMSTGVVDAVWVAPSALYKPWNLSEVGKYVIDGIPGATSALFLLMNKESWASLSREQQAQIDKVTGREMSIRAARAFGAQDAEAFDKARQDPKIEVVKLNDAERAAFEASIKPFIEEQLDDLESKGVPARAIHADLIKHPGT